MKRHHVEGPPGTGKTGYLAGYRDAATGRTHRGQVQRAAELYGGDKVLAVSLTKAAAQELGSRAVGVPTKQIGTLHSLCYHAVGGKVISAAQVRDFNLAHPRWEVAPSEVTSSDGKADAIEGSSDLFSRYELLRHGLVPRSSWYSEIARFDEAWSSYKDEIGVMDFTDMIEHGHSQLDEAPGSPRVIFADEAQDFTPLELATLLQWSESCESLVLVGDRLQALYAWRGADPLILDPTAADFATVLGQSYRVPETVHRRAQKSVRGLPGSEAEYKPTMFTGSVEEKNWSSRQPDEILEDLLGAIAQDRSAIVIAPCGYQLQPLIAAMRTDGIPYHNPYAPRRGQFNPLKNHGVVRRILAFLRPHQGEDPAFIPSYTAAEIKLWAPMLKAECFVGKGKGREALTKLETDAPAGQELMVRLLPEVQDAVFGGDLGWILRHSTAASLGKAIDYIKAVIRRLGEKRFYHEMTTAPRKRPWPTVGTIHSVKGGEADTVALIPDLSPQGYRQTSVPGWAGEEALRRLAYVGITRARSELWIAQPAIPGRTLEV